MNMLNSILTNKHMVSLDVLKKMYPNYVFEEHNRQKNSIADIEWTIVFVVAAIRTKNKKIAENYFVWLHELFENLDVDENDVKLLITSLREVLNGMYPQFHFDPYLDVNFIEDGEFNNHINAENPYSVEMKQYLDALLNADKQKAKEIVTNMLDNGVPVQDVYIHIFQETMRNVGKLWHKGEITYSKEHYCTIVTQYIMSTLYNKIFLSDSNSLRMLACPVGSELHELGIRMVADLFEMNGWETMYLGSNIPHDEIINFAIEFKPNIIALSITMPHLINDLKDLVDLIRDNRLLKNVKIMVGGLPFLNNSKLMKEIGVDAFAMDAIEGLKVAKNLVS